jgi:tRNA pseudouridine55 synthase
MPVAPSGGGVLVVDKARGPTSHDVVGRVRRALGTKQVGHAGTLDPMATGVLVVAVGEATKLVPWLTAQDKSYEATIALGTETDTLDAEGRPTRSEPVSEALLQALGRSHGGTVEPLLRDALEAERARTTQVPPAFSAIQQQGVRAHVRARRGEQVELAPRAVRVARLELVACSVSPPDIAVTLDVDKGYYVRSLARDLAARLGTVGHLTALRRSRSGSFTVGEAVSIESDLAARLIPLVEAATRALPAARLTEQGARDASCGRPVQPGDLADSGPDPCAWLDAGGRLVAVGQRQPDGTGRVVRGFGAH